MKEKLLNYNLSCKGNRPRPIAQVITRAPTWPDYHQETWYGIGQFSIQLLH